MKTKIIVVSVLLLLVAVFTCGCVPFMENLGLVNPVNEEQSSLEKGGSPDGLVKLLIGFKGKPGPAEQAMVNSMGGKIKYTYHLVDAMAASLPQKAIDALQNNPKVGYVEPDGLVSVLDTELDNSWGVKRIGAGLVHDSLNKGTGIKVAIIDTGIDYSHSDLSSNYRGGYDFVNDDDDPMDDHGHGTHVAGTVAALDNSVGVVGVAPEADLYALKVLNSGGGGSYSDVIAALEWCVDNGIQVTNNSYGSSGDGGKTVKAAFDNAYYNYGIIHVGAAGNNGDFSGKGDTIIYPAKYDSVIAVAATNQSDLRASWSSTGHDLEISAPGESIYSTLVGGGYGGMSGTSMASPHVAGTVALMIDAGVSDIRGQIQSTADDLGATGWDSQYGYGLVDADEAAGEDGVGTPPPAGAGTIAGKVTDATSTDSAIGEATVVVEDTSLSAVTDASGYYEINNVVEGTYTVTASAEGYENANQRVTVSADVQSTADFALKPLPAPGKIYVFNIDMTFKKAAAGRNTFYTAVATVTMVDENETPVGGAVVSGHWSGATNDTDSGVTDTKGQISLESKKVKNPETGTTFTFTVDDVIKAGWTYDSEGFVTSKSITAP